MLVFSEKNEKKSSQNHAYTRTSVQLIFPEYIIGFLNQK